MKVLALVGMAACGGAPVAPLHGDRAPIRSRPVQVAVAGDNGCARMSDGTVRCWSFEKLPEIVEVRGVGGARDIQVNPWTSCARTDRGLACWGGLADLPDDRPDDPRPATTARLIPGFADVEDVWLRDVVSCARWRDGALACWGKYNSMTTGEPTTYSHPPEPVIPVLRGAVQLVFDDSGGCARWPGGRVACTGEESYDLADVAGLRSPATIAVRNHERCALSSAGTVQCWRGNARAEEMPGLTEIVQLVSGFCALDRRGKVTCWESWRDQGVQRLAIDLDHVVQIAGGGSSACALRDDASIHCWTNGIPNEQGGWDDVFRVSRPVRIDLRPSSPHLPR